MYAQYHPTVYVKVPEETPPSSDEEEDQQEEEGKGLCIQPCPCDLGSLTNLTVQLQMSQWIVRAIQLMTTVLKLPQALPLPIATLKV